MSPLLVISILFTDQLSKFMIERLLAPSESLALVKGVFHLTLVHNRGAAFGILKNQLPLFITTSCFAILLIWHNLKGCKGSGVSLYPVSLSLILAGAIGNLIDRIRFGYVIDFLDFRIWPVFNIADSAITIGAVLLGISILKPWNRGAY